MLCTRYTTELHIRAGYAAYTAMLDRRDISRSCYCLSGVTGVGKKDSSREGERG